MSDATVALIWITIFVVVGIVVSIGLLTRAHNIRVRHLGTHEDRYRHLAEETATAHEQVATVVADLNRRVEAIETILKEVG